MPRATPPFDFYTEADGSPLEAGKIYVGQSGLDPIANPVQVYSDEAFTQTVTQPIRTVGGYPMSATTSSPIHFFIKEGQYSVAVYDKNSKFIFQSLNVSTEFTSLSLELNALLLENQSAINALQANVEANKVSADAHIANRNDPHGVTAEQVGLGNVNNTSDLDKPISTATQAALDNKQDQIQFWVDAVSGDDSSDGKSEAAARKTIAGFGFSSETNYITLYVKSGSIFREQLTLGDYCQVLPYGNGARPVFNAADVAANGSFSLTGGQTNVYEISWTFDDKTCDVVQIIEDGKPLKWAPSIVDCESTPGSFYNSGQISPATMYVHSNDSSDVTSNGKVYEIAKRSHGIDFGDNCYTRNIVTKNNAHNDGSLTVGANFRANELLIQNGTKHSMLAKEGLHLKDVLFDHCNNKDVTGNASYLTVFNGTLNGGFVVLDNVRFENRRDVSRNSYSVIAHNGGSGSLTYVHLKNSEFKNLALAFANTEVSEHVQVDNCVFTECSRIKDFTGDSKTWVFNKCRFFMADESTMSSSDYIGGSNGVSDAKIIMRGCFVNVAATRFFYGGWELFDVRYCSFFASGGISDFVNYSFFDGRGKDLVGEAAGKFIFKHNIVSGWEQPWRIEATSLDDWGVLDIDYNYYVVFSSETGKYDYLSDNSTFATWQTDSGQDSNSLETNEAAVAFIPFKEASDVKISAMPIIAGADAWESWAQSSLNDDFEIPDLQKLTP